MIALRRVGFPLYAFFAHVSTGVLTTTSSPPPFPPPATVLLSLDQKRRQSYNYSLLMYTWPAPNQQASSFPFSRQRKTTTLPHPTFKYSSDCTHKCELTLSISACGLRANLGQLPALTAQELARLPVLRSVLSNSTAQSHKAIRSRRFLG